MLKLFGKKYVELGELYEAFNNEWNFYHGLFLKHLEVAEAMKDNKETRKYYVNEAQKCSKCAFAIQELKLGLWRKYGKA